MSLLQEHSLVKKIKLFVYHTYWYQLKQSLANKYTKKSIFQEKCLFAKISRLTISCWLTMFLISKKMSIPSPSNNNNNLFLNNNSLLELSQSLLTNITIVPTRVPCKQRYKLCKERQVAGYSRCKQFIPWGCSKEPLISLSQHNNIQKKTLYLIV